MYFNHRILIFLLCSGIWITDSCDKETAEGTDKFLYDLSVDNFGHQWFGFSDQLLNKSSGSGHNQSFLRTRYNTVAAVQLDSTGRVKSGISFPNGSLIVKELVNSPGTVFRYAIMYKDSTHVDSDSNGWVWGYINGDGTVAEPASSKGSICTGCHAQSGHIDQTLMNKFFP